MSDNNGVWLLYGETAFIQVTEAVTLTYGGNSYPLVAGETAVVWR